MKKDPRTYYMYDGERYDCNISYTSASMQAPSWIFKMIQLLLDTDVQLRSISISTPSLCTTNTLNDLKIDSNSHQKTKSSKMNTAKKLSYEERFKNMGETDQYSISQAMFRDTKDAIDLYDFLEELKGKKAEDQQSVLRLAQADILAILLDKVELTKNYLGINSSPLDLKSTDTGSGQKEPAKMGPEKAPQKQTESKKETKVVQMKPDPESPAGKQQTTEAKVEPKVEEKKTEVTTTPDFKDVVTTCKTLLKEEGGPEKAFEYAKLYFGTGNYIPKKDKQKPAVWEDKKILSWINDISKAIGQAEKATKFVEEKTASTKDNTDIKPAEETKEEKETEQELNPLAKMRALKGYLKSIQKNELKRTPKEDDKLTDTEKKQYAVVGKFAPTYVGTGIGAGIPMFDRDRLVGYSIPANGLSEETKALNIFAERYLQLISKGSEDKEVADAILPVFFSNRGYDEEQIQKWIKAIKNAGEELSKVDHLTILGTPKVFFPEGLKQAELSYDDFVAILRDTEKSLEEKQTVCTEHLSGKSVKWDPFEMELHTDNHVYDYVTKKIIEVEENDKQNAIHTYDQQNMAILCQAAFENSVSEEDFIKEHIDLILKPDGTFRTLENKDNGYKVEIKNKGDFEKYVHDIYEKVSKEDTTLETQKENGTVSVEKKEESEVTDRRITVLKSAFESKLKSHEDVRSLFDDPFIQDLLENGVVIDAHSDPDHKETTIEYFEAGNSKKLKEYLKAYHAKVNDIKYTKPDKFEDGDVRVYTFPQLKEEGDKLVKAGKTREEMIAWASKNVLKRQLEDQPDEKSVYQEEQIIPNMVDAMFGFGEKKQNEALMSEEAGKDAIDKMLKDEKMELMQIIKATRDIYKKMNQPKSLKDVHTEIIARAKAECPEKYKLHQERVKKVGETKQTFIQEKFSQIHPEDWKKLKDIVMLDDLFNACVSYKDKDDWRVGLALALEVIPLGKIPSAKDWTVEQITEWYNTKVLSDPTTPVEEKKEEPKKEEPTVEVPEHLNEVMNASSPKSFKRALDETVKNHEDTQEARKNMINAIKFGTGKHTKKISKMPEKDIHDMINAAKTRVEKHKK